MNSLQINLTQQTLDKFLKSTLATFKQENPVSKDLVNSNGVKVTGNVKVKTINVDSLTLKEPNIIDLNNVHVEFDLLNIVVEVDIKRIHDEIKVIDLPGDRFDLKISWDFFNDQPDIRLTFGIEEYFHPTFTASMIWIINGLNISAGLNDFDVHDFNIPNDLGSKIEEQIIKDIKDIIKEKIGEHAGKVLDFIGDLVRFLPVDNLGNWIIQQITESEGLKVLVEQAVKDNLKPETLYSVPNQFELGTDQNKVSVSLADENPVVVSVKESHLTTLVSFKEL